MILFAQASIENIPSDILKWVLAVLVVLLLITVAILTIINFGRKQSVNIDPQPLEVRKQSKRFNHDLAEQRHEDATRRLAAHDAEIDSLWNAVRVDIPAMERRINEAGEDRSGKIHDRINEILAAVSELKGKLK